MNNIIHSLEGFFGSLPLPLLEVWGRLAYILGFALALAAFGGFTFRPGGRWGFGRERQAWDAKAILSIPLTFLFIVASGYLGSFIVLVPGAQTFESLKDLVVFLCVVLFGYPALITVPFAYGLSDLIEGVPPNFLLNWLPGYFINPACFWMAYQLFGKDPNFKKAKTWGLYLLFVLAFLILEPILWGYICSDKFTSPFSYRNITSALFFTTSLTWLLAPFTMLAALPLARKFGMFWAEIPGHVKEKLIGRKDWLWEAGAKGVRPKTTGLTEGWPIRMVILTPFIALMLLMVGTTAYVTLRSAEQDANKLALHLHEEISRNIDLQLDEYLSQVPAVQKNNEDISDLLRRLPALRHGLALVINQSGMIIASSAAQGSAVAALAVEGLDRTPEGLQRLAEGVQYRFEHVTEKPLGRTTWLARAVSYKDRRGEHDDWILLSVMPESYYLAGIQAGNSRSAMVFALALLLALGVAAFLAAIVTKGLRRLSLATQSLARGDLSQRVPGSRLEELGALSNSFNHMAARLFDSINHLRQEVEKRKSRERELEKSELRTRTSENRLQLALKAGNFAIWDWDVLKNHLVWDDSMYKLYGVRKEDFGGAYEAWSKCLDPEDLAKATNDVEAALRGERPFDSEFRIRLKDGSTRVLKGVGQVLRDPRGKALRMVGINWDITENKYRDVLLTEETRILGMIAAGAPLPDVLDTIVRGIEAITKDMIGSILLMDSDGVHVRHGAAPNLPEAYNKVIEGSPIGPNAGSCGTAAHRGEAVIVTDIQTDPLWEDYRKIALDNNLRACWSTPIKDTHGKVLGTFAMYYHEPRVPVAEDFTLIQRATHLAGVAIERQKAEDDIRAHERNLLREKRFIDTLMDSLPGVVSLFDETGAFLKWNKVLETVTGYTGGEVAKMAPSDFVPPESRGTLSNSIRTVLFRGKDALELPLLTKDQKTLPYYFNSVRMPTERGPGILVIGIDISDRRRLEEQFHQAQKMEAVGHMAGGIAHDFNNLLTAIIGFSELLKDALDPSDPRHGDAEQIIATSKRAADLTGQLLAFSRKQVLQPVLVDLNHNIGQMQKMLRRIIGEDVVLVTRLEEGSVRCLADPSQIEQAILNLAINARDAMPQGGRLTVETRNVLLGEDYCRLHPEAKPGNYAEVNVSDTGTGMTPEVQARVFEPFFTTKEVGKGTGLGLPMVYGIVQQSGGHIEVSSKIGIGTTFKLFFPSAEGPVAEDTTRSTTPTPNGTETILVVEDEDALRGLASRCLKSYGYQVLTATNGLDALRVIDGYDKTINILVTDVVMPHLSGPGLAETVHMRFPDMPILFVSGHADDTVFQHGLPRGETSFLPKPYTPIGLAKKVREVLDEHQQRAKE